MAMNSSVDVLPLQVARKLGVLRRLVRGYVWMEGIASFVLLGGAAFWLGLATDWLLEPSPGVRIALQVVLGALAAFCVYRWLVRRVFARFSDAQLAMLLERRFPQLNESLMTTVERAGYADDSDGFHPAMLQETSAQAVDRLKSVRVLQVFQYVPVVWKTTAAVVLMLSVAALAWLARDTFDFWIKRICLTNQLWPRRVQLQVYGFEPDTGRNAVKVARDDPYELKVAASIRDGFLAPASVQIRYRLADGARGVDNMIKVGDAIPGRDDHQQFRYDFKNVVDDIAFEVIGGDDRIENLHLQVVDRPQIVRMVLDCSFPEYLQRPPRTIPVSGRVEIPEGSHAICRVYATKPLRQVEVRELSAGPESQLSARIDEAIPDFFQFPLDVGDADRTLLVTMRDQDGIENREPYRVVVSATRDEPPDVAVRLDGIGSAVTPDANIQLAGEITDDHGLQEVWFEYQVDKQEVGRRTMSVAVTGRKETRRLDRFDLADTEPGTNRRLVEVEPGQRLSLAVKASDAYDLTDTLHDGSSHRMQLDVVTPSELRAILEKRELGLRQRFESTHERMIGIRELLDRIGVDRPQDAAAADRQAEVGDVGTERDRLRVAGALQAVTQLAQETEGIALGFERIVAELVNNRVDTEELKQRLEVGIAAPLRVISAELMPAAEASYQALEKTIADGGNADLLLRTARGRSDEVLRIMRQVLNRMLELESYNELVALLREIIQEQQDLTERTRQFQAEKLRSLLEEE